MNDLVRPSSLLGTRAQAAGPSGVLGTIHNPPQEVTQLATGTTLQGVVVGSDGKGHVMVRTELGTLAVATRAHLAVNSEVTLQVRSSGAQLLVLLMHSGIPAGGGRAVLPNGPHTAQPNAAQTAGQGAQGGVAPPPDLLTLGQTVRAILQAPNPSPAAIPGTAGPQAGAGPVQLPPGTELQLHILTVQSPPPAQGTPPGNPPQGAITPAAAQADPPAPAQPAVPPVAGGPPGTVSESPATPLPQASGGQPGPSGQHHPGIPLGSQPAVPGSQAPPTNPSSIPLGSQPAVPGSQAPEPSGGQAGTPPPTGAQAPVGTGPAQAPSAKAAAASYSPAPSQGAGTPSPPTAGGLPVQAPPASGVPRADAGPAASTPAAIQSTVPAASSGAYQFNGLVTATTHAGRPILQTPLGTMTLEVQSPLPLGTRMTLELPIGALLQSGAAGGAESPVSPSTLAYRGPALEEALLTLQTQAGAAPGAIEAPMLGAIPQPGPKLTSTLLFFLSALSSGEIDRWLGGQAMQTLRNAGRNNLLTRLGQDFKQMSRLAESAGGDWHLYFIPLWDDDQAHQIRLFVRHGPHDGHGQDDDPEDDSTRFVLEVELSRVGDLQLDGLVRGKRFDLILRTRTPMPETMRRDITQIFHDANEATGYRGNIGFQASGDWHLMPIQDTEAAASNLVV